VIRWKRPGPLVQMTLALVTMTISILLLGDLLLGVSSQREQQQNATRKTISESIAVQAAELMREDNVDVLDRFLRVLLQRVPDLRSAGVRRVDGTLLTSVGPHEQAWGRFDRSKSTPQNVRVPLLAGGKPWGAMELAYRAESSSWWMNLLYSPLTRQLLFVALVGAVGYAMYMRRALQHLDPSAVIPERVQRAFDAMAEGVVVLDARGRVMLANRAFRAMGQGAVAELAIGQPLSSLPWLAAALPSDVSRHPWVRAMAERQNTSDEPLLIRTSTADSTAEEHDARRLVVSCAPISDAGGAVRGCMATFNDMTELHRTNVALTRAMAEIEAGKQELRRQNLELERLATQDVLSGCLNRRAFMDAAAPLLQQVFRHELDLGVLMLDIDHFKSINDTHGHAIGDRVIAELGGALRNAVPANHVVGRYGGEEFCILSPGASPKALLATAERIRAHVQDVVGQRVAEQPGLRVTVSIGANCEHHGVDSLAGFIDRADQALYRAKRSGRNRVAQFTAGESTEPAEAAAAL